MKSSVLLACSVTLALSPYVAAQNTPTWTHSHTSYWDSTTVGTGGPVVRMVSGEVTGGAQLDVLALGGSGGTQLLLLDAVESNLAMLLYGPAVRDFDLTPKDATTGRQDVIYVDATGLWRTNWIAGTGFDSPDLVTTPVGQPWALAKKVRCGLVDATAGLDYVGLSLNQRRVLYFGGTEWSTPDTGPRVYEMLLADWSGDAQLEIVLLTHDGLRVLNAASTELASYARTYVAGDAIATFRTGNGSTQGVAWLCQVSGGGAPSLSVKTSAPGVVPASLDLADAVAVRGGDANCDGKDDLIFARANAIAPSWLCNTGTTVAPDFSTTTRSIAIANPGISPPTGPGVAPLLTDLDNDQITDVFASVSGTSAAALVLMVADFTPIDAPEPPGGPLGMYVNSELQMNATPIPGFFPRCGGEVDGAGAVVYDNNSKLKWSAYFDVIPPEATHVEIQLWKRQVAPVGQSFYTDPACLLLRYLPLGSDPNLDFTYRAIMDIPTTQLSTAVSCNQRALWIEMRLVQITGVIGTPTSIDKGWPMYTAVLFAGCGAVTGMLPPHEPGFSYGMDATVDICGSLTCTEGWETVACLFGNPGSTPPPMVNVRNKRPLPPGTVPILPSPIGGGSIIPNDVP